MTTIEAKEILKNRVEWKKPPDTRFSFLESPTPESGRYLQEEHSSVNIPIIYDTVVDKDIEDNDFKQYLLDSKEEAILQMLHDVFIHVKEIEESCINDNTGLFDYAIILKHTINNISKVVNSTRINMQETVTKENLNRYYIDLNGIKDRENGVFVPGFVERYREEIERIQKVLFVNDFKLEVITEQ